MEIVAAIGAGLTLARIMIQGFSRGKQKTITYEQHSPAELDKVVGSVSRRRGSEPVGNSIEVLKDVFLKAPETIRRFILLLDGSPSPQDIVAHVEGKRGYFRGLMKRVVFRYRGSSDITGIIVYSRSYVQSGEVVVMAGGVGQTHLQVKVNLGDFVHSYKDIEIVVLVRASSEQPHVVARQPTRTRGRSAARAPRHGNSGRPPTSRSLPRNNKTKKFLPRPAGIDPSSSVIFNSSASHSLRDQNYPKQHEPTSSKVSNPTSSSSPVASRMVPANFRGSSPMEPQLSPEQTQASSRTGNPTNIEDSILPVTKRTRRRNPQSLRRNAAGGPSEIVDATRLSTTDSSENETKFQKNEGPDQAAKHNGRSRTRRPARNQKGTLDEADCRRSSSQSAVTISEQPTRRNAVTAAPCDVPSSSQQHCILAQSHPNQADPNSHEEFSLQGRSRTRKR